ncbi:MAG: Tim44 domain-containing protein [Alphaproteobacteria bacterium]|nr:Tim44 domain-containing protein [Alphaproteobacteria bacterium]
MGGFSQYFDIILFAMVAAFLILRLRSVLGRRTGNERRRDPFMRRAEATADKVVALPERNKSAVPAPVAAEPGDAVARGLEAIRGADPGFDPGHFLAGARAAFEMIVGAFARGDKEQLRSLLNDEVYRSFAAAMDERAAAGESLETRIVQLKHLDMAQAELDGRTARVTVKLVSDQINVLRAHDGSIVDGDPEHPIEKTDFWTFARDIRSADPNWQLVATGS